MNLFVLIIAVIMPGLLGFLVVSCWWPNCESRPAEIWVKICLSIGIGLGFTSWTELLTLILNGSAQIVMTLIIEALMMGLFGSILWWRKIPLFPAITPAPLTPLNSKRTGILTAAFGFSLVFAFSIFVLRAVENPHGEADAWTFWNARARLFFRTGLAWRQIFSEGRWSFPTYPLQTSMNVLRLWSAIDRESQIGPILIAGLFTFASIGLVASVVSRLRGPSQGAIGGLLLASTPYFLKHGASQYADVPFGFYVLACLALLNLADELPEQHFGLIGLAGLNAGFAAWTKQEGVLFVVSLLLAVVSVTGLFRKHAAAFWGRTCLALLGGLVPAAVVIAYYRSAIAPAPLEASPHNFQQLMERLTDISRYIVTAKAVIRHIAEPYSLVYSTPIAVLALYTLFLGVLWKQFKKPGVIMSGIILGLMGSGYFLVYITTSADLIWLLQTTLARLFLQLWPTMILTALLVIATPDERLTA